MGNVVISLSVIHIPVPRGVISTSIECMSHAVGTTTQPLGLVYSRAKVLLLDSEERQAPKLSNVALGRCQIAQLSNFEPVVVGPAPHFMT